jgi:hypothetical protein
MHYIFIVGVRFAHLIGTNCNWNVYCLLSVLPPNNDIIDMLLHILINDANVAVELEHWKTKPIWETVCWTGDTHIRLTIRVELAWIDMNDL